RLLDTFGGKWIEIMKKPYENRRNFLKMAGLGGVGVLTTPYLPFNGPNTPSAISETGTPEMTPLNRFPRMIQEYMVGRVREIEREANGMRNAVKTKEDAEQYVENVRQKIHRVLGPWPKKTPLNARTTRK